MSESVRQDLPARRPDDHIAFRTSTEQNLVIRKAAELVGWTVPQYVLCAALDRAERDLYEHAAAEPPDSARRPETTEHRDRTAEPFVAVISALG